MSPRTRFLSRLLGIYCLVMAVVMATHRELILGTIVALVHDQPLMFITGIITLFAGIAMVLVHNIWTDGALAVAVTLIGWITLLKGALLLLLSPAEAADFYLGTLRYPELFYGYAAVSLVLGIALAFGGFRAARH